MEEPDREELLKLRHMHSLDPHCTQYSNPKKLINCLSFRLLIPQLTLILRTGTDKASLAIEDLACHYSRSHCQSFMPPTSCT